MNRGNLILCALLVGQLALVGFRSLAGEDSMQGLKRGLLIEGIKTDNLMRILIESGSDDEEVVTVERATTDDDWHVLEESNYPADTSKVDSTLRELAGLEIADVISSTGHHHVDLKVADSEFEKRVILEGGDEKVELLFGTTGRASSVHVRRADQDTVYAVRDYSSWRLSTRPDAWIDKAYFTVDEKRIVMASIKNEHGSFRLERHLDNSWALVVDDGEPVPADKSEVESFLGKIDRISMTKVAGREGDDGLDLTNAAVELVVGLGTPAKPENKQAEEDGEAPSTPDNTTASSADEASGPIAIETSRTLRVALKEKDSDFYLMSTEGSPFIAQISKWSMNTLLDAKAEDFLEKEDNEEQEDDKASP